MAQAGGGGRSGSEGEVPRAVDQQGRLSVLVELRGGPGSSPSFAMSEASRMDVPGFHLDTGYPAVPLGGGGAESPAGGTETFLVRGAVDREDVLDALRQRPEVVNAHPDTVVEHFGPSDTLPGSSG